MKILVVGGAGYIGSHIIKRFQDTDPHTAAELNLDQIWKIVDELVDAHGSMPPDFKQ